MNAGGVETVAAVMRCPNTTPALQAAVVQALAKLSTSARNAEQIAALGGLEGVVQLLKACVFEPALFENGLSTIVHLVSLGELAART